MARAPFVVLVALVLAQPLLGGCAGMIARAVVTRAATYEEMSIEAGAFDPQHARVWLYAVGGGPTLWNTLGSQAGITFNRSAYFYAGDSFHLLDLEAGEYLVSTGRVMGGFGAPRIGKYQRTLRFEPAQEYFLRILAQDNAPFSSDEQPFDLVGRDQALVEMQGLKFFTDGQRVYRVKGD